MVCFFSQNSLCPLNLLLSIDSSCYIVLLFKNDNCLDLHLDQLIEHSLLFPFVIVAFFTTFFCHCSSLFVFHSEPIVLYFKTISRISPHFFFLLSLLIAIKMLILFFSPSFKISAFKISNIHLLTETRLNVVCI